MHAQIAPCTNYRSFLVSCCLTKLRQNKDDWRHPPPFFRLGTGTTTGRVVTEFDPFLLKSPCQRPTSAAPLSKRPFDAGKAPLAGHGRNRTFEHPQWNRHSMEIRTVRAVISGGAA